MDEEEHKGEKNDRMTVEKSSQHSLGLFGFRQSFKELPNLNRDYSTFLPKL